MSAKRIINGCDQLPQKPDALKMIDEINAKKLRGKDSNDGDEDVLVAKKPLEGRDSEEVAPAASIPTAQIQQLITTARNQARDEFEQELKQFEDKIAQYDQRVAEAEQQLKDKESEMAAAKDQAEAERNQLINTFCLGGSAPFQAAAKKDSNPNTGVQRVSTVMGRYHDKDLLSEYNRIIERDCAGFNVSTPSGSVLTQKDMRHADSFYHQHRDSILRAVEQDMKNNGFLQGGIASRDSTTPGDIPYAFLDAASAEGRLTHHEGLIYWQFAQRKSDPSISVEQTGRFPRLEYGATGSSFSDYILGSDHPTLHSDTESVRGSSVPIEIRELGLGRPGTNLKPISVSEVITSNSIFDALGAVNMRLVKSFNRSVDMGIRSLIHNTSRGGYVSGDALVETAAEVTGGGQITQKFLSYLYGYMAAQNIPTLPDGCYFLVMPPQSYSVLRSDMIDRLRITSEADAEGLLNVLRESYGEDMVKRVSGYQGKIEGFHVFQATSHGTGAPGSEGVQTETLNGASVTTRNCYAFGIQTVGVLESMPFTIRQRAENSFGRSLDFIWLAHQGYGALDIDPARSGLTWETPGDRASEQLRVFDIRCADVAV